MKLIGEKWTNIQTNIDKEKVTRKDILDERLLNLEDRINKERPEDETKFRILKEQVLKLQEALENEKGNIE